MNNQYDVVSFSIMLAVMSLVPLLVVTTTSFLKISMVLLVLRNAIGVQQVPPTLAIYGISLALTVFIMAPTVKDIGARAMSFEVAGSPASKLPLMGRAQEAFEPMRTFMMKFSNPDQRELFLASAKKLWPPEQAKDASTSDILILIPAFVVSELQAGYEIGFLIYIPFVVIDLLVSNLLMALGMQQVSPTTITIPLKLLLFTLVSGWAKLLNALAVSYV
ncbi:MAG: type III secretion system export apparatus subunit SctR [Janthinobacterium lividum]